MHYLKDALFEKKVIIIYPSYQLAHPFLFTVSLILGLVLNDFI